MSQNIRSCRPHGCGEEVSRSTLRACSLKAAMMLLLRGGEIPLPPPSIEPSEATQLQHQNHQPLVRLTPSGVYTLYKGDTTAKPVVQIVEMKKTSGPPAGSTASDRYFLTLSDGAHTLKAMLATDLNPLVEERGLCELCAVRLVEYISNSVDKRRIIIINEMELLASPEEMGGSKIGNPVSVEREDSNTATAGSVQGTPDINSPAATSPPPAQTPAIQGQDVGDDDAVAIPINRLSPYVAKWKITAKVTSRGGVKHWNKPTGSGKLFSANVIDAEGGEIRCTFFNEAVDKFYDTMKEGSVVELGKGRLKTANKAYSSLKNDYEINFGGEAHVSPVSSSIHVGDPKYDFKPLAGIESTDPNAYVDIIALVKDFAPSRNIVTKQGKELNKRELTLADDSGCQIQATIWGDKASMPPSTWESQPIVAFRGAKVSDWNGRSLSTGAGTVMKINPDLPDAKKIRRWWDFGGQSTTLRSLSTNPDGTPAINDDVGGMNTADFVPLSSLEEAAPNSVVDVIGIVRSASEEQKITNRQGKEVMKRTVAVVDDSGVQVNVAIWGERAGRESSMATRWSECPVIALKGARVSDYDGRTLSVTSATQIELDPAIDRANTMRTWFASQGNTLVPRKISIGADGSTETSSRGETLKLESIEKLNEIMNAPQNDPDAVVPDYVTLSANVSFIRRENPWYACCPSSECNAKVVPNGDNKWHCDKDGQTYDHKTNRYVLQVSLQDETATAWATAFGDQASVLMDGVDADKLEQTQDVDPDAFDMAFQAAQDKPFIFTLRLKRDEYQESVRVRATIVKIVKDETGQKSEGPDVDLNEEIEKARNSLEYENAAGV